MEFLTDPAAPTTPMLRLVVACGCLGMLLFGYDIGVMSGSLDNLGDTFDFTTIQKELVVSSVPFMAAFGAPSGASYSNRYGGVPAIRTAGILYLIGAAFVAAAPNFYVILSGRIILGIAVGWASSVIPVYVSECTPAALRGYCVVCCDLSIVIGQVLAGLLNGCFQYSQGEWWRWTNGLAGAPAMVLIIGVDFLSESPRFLLYQGQREAARLSLCKLRSTSQEVDMEVEEIHALVQNEVERIPFREQLHLLWVDPTCWSTLKMGSCLMAMNQVESAHYSACLLGYKSDTCFVS